LSRKWCNWGGGSDRGGGEASREKGGCAIIPIESPNFCPKGIRRRGLYCPLCAIPDSLLFRKGQGRERCWPAFPILQGKRPKGFSFQDTGGPGSITSGKFPAQFTLTRTDTQKTPQKREGGAAKTGLLWPRKSGARKLPRTYSPNEMWIVKGGKSLGGG